MEEIEVGMFFKTTTGAIHKVKSIDSRFPLGSIHKYPIVYADDNKTCWGLESIQEYSWDEIL